MLCSGAETSLIYAMSEASHCALSGARKLKILAGELRTGWREIAFRREGNAKE